MAQAERQRVSRKPPDSLDAWEVYHRGLWHFLNQEPSENQLAKGFFQRAIDLNSGFAAGHYALALCSVWDGWVYASRPMEDCVGTARPLAQRALALDDADSMSHFVMGLIAYGRGHSGWTQRVRMCHQPQSKPRLGGGCLGGPLCQRWPSARRPRRAKQSHACEPPRSSHVDLDVFGGRDPLLCR